MFLKATHFITPKPEYSRRLALTIVLPTICYEYFQFKSVLGIVADSRI